MRSLISLCLLISLSPLAHGWGEDGHIIVCKIAEGYLKPTAKAAIKELLDDRSISDSRLCVWADLIRSGAIYDRKYPNHRTWHYVNLELQLKEDDYHPEKMEDHVLEAIPRFAKLMNDDKLMKEDRKEALLFVIHFVGDMHQPLHCANRNDDKGGNLQLIKSFRGKEESKLNLHSIWDTHLVKAERGELTNDDFVKRLLGEITEKERETWSGGDTKTWGWEAHQIGVKEVYSFSDGKALPLPTEPLAELTDDNYIKSKLPLVRTQLKRAGVRLSKVLNEAFPEK
jgi:hypothetical protein